MSLSSKRQIQILLDNDLDQLSFYENTLTETLKLSNIAVKYYLKIRCLYWIRWKLDY